MPDLLLPLRTDAELVCRAQDGCRSSFDGLVLRYEQKAFAAAYRLVGHAEDAREVVQEAFVRAFRKLGTLQDAARFAAWFMRILTNHALNFRRARGSVPPSLSLQHVEQFGAAGSSVRGRPRKPAPDQALQIHELTNLAQQAILELPELQRRALVLSSIEQRPQREIASDLGCSVEAVKWHVFQARKSLRQRLAEHLVAG